MTTVTKSEATTQLWASFIHMQYSYPLPQPPSSCNKAASYVSHGFKYGLCWIKRQLNAEDSPRLRRCVLVDSSVICSVRWLSQHNYFIRFRTILSKTKAYCCCCCCSRRLRCCYSRLTKCQNFRHLPTEQLHITAPRFSYKSTAKTMNSMSRSYFLKLSLAGLKTDNNTRQLCIFFVC